MSSCCSHYRFCNQNQPTVPELPQVTSSKLLIIGKRSPSDVIRTSVISYVSVGGPSSQGSSRDLSFTAPELAGTFPPGCTFCLWILHEVIRAHLPAGVYSTQISYNIKGHIGMAQHGAITFVSGLCVGSMSDREIFNLSGIASLLTPDMAIMVDKEFLVDDIALLKIYRPSFPSSNIHMSREDDRKAQSVARLKVHVEIQEGG
ncbi:hypothetical protein Q5P01_021336 [Channa striata]|uniref:DDE Tnp4 domain-containing protein n=1 Tax=Channa striata TaxID=64152 RepID=A0AA88LU49_CHASR|nr:hypothetical protein Q5P01_021336 [Channa striata]